MKSIGLEFRLNAQIGNVESLQFLLMRGCHFLHLSVIGLENGHLAFEDEYGGVNSISPASLTEIIKAYRPPSIAFVAASYGYMAGLALVEAGVAHVVAATADAMVSMMLHVLFMCVPVCVFYSFCLGVLV